MWPYGIQHTLTGALQTNTDVLTVYLAFITYCNLWGRGVGKQRYGDLFLK